MSPDGKNGPQIENYYDGDMKKTFPFNSMEKRRECTVFKIIFSKETTKIIALTNNHDGYTTL